MRRRICLPGAARRLAVGVAVALSLNVPAGQAQQLGRLFSTPEERALLEELRRESEIVESEPRAVMEIEDAPAVEQLTIDGLVIRSSGANSAWINGRPVSGGASSREGVRVETTSSKGGRVKIKLPSGVDTIELKPGQKVDVDSGVVVEAYEHAPKSGGGSVFDQVVSETATVSPPAPAAAPKSGEGAKESEPGAPRAIRYPEAFLEQIRRMLQGG